MSCDFCDNYPIEECECGKYFCPIIYKNCYKPYSVVKTGGEIKDESICDKCEHHIDFKNYYEKQDRCTHNNIETLGKEHVIHKCKDCGYIFKVIIDNSLPY